MRKSVLMSFLILALFFMFIPLSIGRTTEQFSVIPQDISTDLYAPGELLVGLRNVPSNFSANSLEFGLSFVDAILSDYDLQSIEPLYGGPYSIQNTDTTSRIYKLVFSESENLASVISRLSHSDAVVFAEPNYLYKSFWTPDDSYFNYQWNLSNGSSYDSDINMTETWGSLGASQRGGSSDVVVAVIDTGVAYEDYNDGTQYYQISDLASTNFVSGYDFVNSDSHPNDDNYHGTHVTGTIAQSTDNSEGVAGIAYDVSIMPIKALNSNGVGSSDDIANAMDFARQNGADVINMSLGSTIPSIVIEQAVERAIDAGIIVVAATGNDGSSTISYPARYDGVVAVGATRYDATRSSYSNYGEGIDLVAPGGDTSVDQNGDSNPDGILQQTIVPYMPTSSGYYWFQGTSMAAPHVSAISALLLSLGMSSVEVVTVLQDTARDLGASGYDTQYGYGLLDAEAALRGMTSVPSAPSGITGYSDSGQTLSFASGSSHSYATPHFEWNDVSGATGYYVYFGQDQNADPRVDGSLQLNFDYTASLDVGNRDTYYLRVKTEQDSLTSGEILSFTYIFDNSVGSIDSGYVQATTDGLIFAWDSPIDASYQGVTYDVYRARGEYSTYDSSVFSQVASGIYDHIRSYTDSSVRAGQDFTYCVVAVDDLGNRGSCSVIITHSRIGDYSIVAGAGYGGGPHVRVFDSAGGLVSQFFAFAESFRGGVNVATGDVDGDGDDEIIVGAGKDGGPQVRVFDLDGNLQGGNGFFAYAENFRGGVKVSTGDLNGDGVDEIITGTGVGGGPQVRTFDMYGNAQFTSGFFAYADTFRGGVEVTAGDLNGDGIDEIITGTGVGGGPHVRMFDAYGNLYNGSSGFFAYGQNFRGGVLVASGDLNGDGTDEIITGTGNGGGPQVRIFNGSGDLQFTPGFFAYAENFRGGVLVGVGDLDNDGREDIVTGTGVGGGPHVRIFDYVGNTNSPGFFAYAENFRGGVNVAIGDIR